MLGSLNETLSSTPLTGGGSSNLGSTTLDSLHGLHGNVYSSLNLPTLGASVLPTENTGGQGVGGPDHQHQQGGVGFLDSQGQGTTQTGSAGNVFDPKHHG